MSKTTKRVNKTKEQIVSDLKISADISTQEAKKEQIKTRMEALRKLEEELGCVFVPLIQYTKTGSQTYIAPFDAPEEETKEEPVV